VGGMVPLGYVSRDKKLFIEEEEAERVRTIFQRYLELGSIGLLLADLRERGIVTKVRQLSDGRTIGGIPFTRGPLAYLLRNRFYIGEVVFKGQICPGEHTPILDRGLFEAVQQRLAEQHNGYREAKAGLEALLAGRIFDDRGNRMSPSHSRKGGARYGYYVSSALIQGQPQSAGSGRVRAFHVKDVNAKTVRAILVTHASRKSTLVTDEALIYRKVGREFTAHKRVFHKHGWYVTDDGFTTNDAENFFGQFKKSLAGTYQHCSEQHLQRYLTEFEFRYSHRVKLGFNDGERTVLALKGIEGKRLTYRPTHEDQEQETVR
jgi:ISXO2-like transposase domain/Recombinase